MPTSLSLAAQEEGTYVVKLSFWDEDNVPVTPTTAKWTLTDTSGVVINSRLDVAIAGGDLSSSVDVVLSGDDLQTTTQSLTETRIFTVEATYDTTINGHALTDLPLHGAAQFTIENIVAI